jgi:lysozyme
MRLTPYLDSVGCATISAGVTWYPSGKRVTLDDPPITKERALQLFKHILSHYEKAVWSVTRDDLNQNQINALVSICYNIGITGFKRSTLLKKVNHNLNDFNIRNAFLAWRFAGGKPILLERRKRESALFFLKDWER